ncbi:MAG: hypothetical protein FJ293_10140 [Planctomycetes bacterium]|nr:hypothetical protein [Planctomycetota bacterium]
MTTRFKIIDSISRQPIAGAKLETGDTLEAIAANLAVTTVADDKGEIACAIDASHPPLWIVAWQEGWLASVITFPIVPHPPAPLPDPIVIELAPPMTVEVIVRSFEGSAIEGAAVEAVRPWGRDAMRLRGPLAAIIQQPFGERSITDANGRAVVRCASGSNVRFSASALGFAGASRELTIAPAPRPIDLTLHPFFVAGLKRPEWESHGRPSHHDMGQYLFGWSFASEDTALGEINGPNGALAVPDEQIAAMRAELEKRIGVSDVDWRFSVQLAAIGSPGIVESIAQWAPPFSQPTFRELRIRNVAFSSFAAEDLTTLDGAIDCPATGTLIVEFEEIDRELLLNPEWQSSWSIRRAGSEVHEVVPRLLPLDHRPHPAGAPDDRAFRFHLFPDRYVVYSGSPRSPTYSFDLQTVDLPAGIERVVRIKPATPRAQLLSVLVEDDGGRRHSDFSLVIAGSGMILQRRSAADAPLAPIFLTAGTYRVTVADVFGAAQPTTRDVELVAGAGRQEVVLQVPLAGGP